MNRIRCRRFFVAIVLAACCSAAPAATFAVTSLADSGSGSLREAIVDANVLAGPDIIDMRALSGVLELATPLPTIASDITILGPGAATLMITRGPFGPTGTITDNVFTLPAQSGAWLKVDGLRFAHTAHLEWRVAHVGQGTAAEFDNCEIERTGGFINNAGLTFRDCIVVRNSGLNYGAVLQEGTEGVVITAERTLFQHNVVHASSSAMHTEAGVLEERAGWAYFTDCRLLDNDGRQGAGAIRAAGHLRVRDCVFRNNTTLPTSRGGGAIRLEGPLLEWTIERSLFDANSSSYGGGLCVGYVGYHNPAPIPALVYDCCFKANIAALDGGGAFAESGITHFVGCTVSGNTAGNVGGGVGGRAGSFYLFTSTVTLNSAVSVGGSTVVSAPSCVIAGNTAAYAPDVNSLGPAGGHNFIGVVPQPQLPFRTFLDNPTDTAGTVGNALDPMLGPLQDNGGPLPTHMPLPGSPLIDGGSMYQMTNANTFNPTKFERLTDSRGLPRIVDVGEVRNPIGGDGMDIGAVEVQMPWRLSAAWPVIRFATSTPGVPSDAVELRLEADSLPGALQFWVAPPFELSRNVAAGYGTLVQSDLPDSSGNLGPMSLFIRYRPQSSGRHDAMLRIVGSTSQEILLAGVVASGPTQSRLFVEDAFLAFHADGPFSPHLGAFLQPRTTIVSGSGLTSSITVTAPIPFEVSLTPSGDWSTSLQIPPPAGGTLEPTLIYVRHHPSAAGSHFGQLSFTASAAQTAEVELYGFYLIQLNQSFIPMAPNDWNHGYHPLMFMCFHAPGLGIATEEQSIMVWFLPSQPGAGPITVEVTWPFEAAEVSGASYASSVTRPMPPPHGSTTPVYIRYRPSAGMSHRGRLRVTCPGRLPMEIPLLGIVDSPVLLETSTPSLTFTQNPTLPPNVLSYQVWGSGLTAPVNVTCSGAYVNGGISPFMLSLNPATDWSYSVIIPVPLTGVLAPVTVYMKFEPNMPPNYGANYGGKVFHLSRKAAAAVIRPVGPFADGLRPEVYGMEFNCGLGGPSAPQLFRLRGVNVGPATVTAPPEFEVALASTGPWGSSVNTTAPVAGVLEPFPVYVRYCPSMAGAHTGLVVASASGVQSVQVYVSGRTSSGFVEASTGQLIFQQPGTSTTAGVASYQVHGYGLSAPITASVSAPFEVALSAAGPFGQSVVTAQPVDGHVAPTTVYVRYNPTSGTVHGAEVVHSSGAATADSVTLSGAINSPVVFVSSLPLAFTTGMVAVPSMTQTYEVSGVFLSAPVQVVASPHFEVSLSPGGGFGPSVLSPAPVDGVVAPVTVYARYVPTSGTQHAGVIVHASAGAPQVDLIVDGAIVPPVVQASVTGLQFAVPVVGMASPEQVYDVSAQNLIGPVIVSAPGGFEVSLTSGSGFGPSVVLSGTGGALAPTAVHVRYRPTSGSQHAGQLDHATQGGAAVQLSLYGEVTPPRIVVSSTSLDFVSLTVGLASAPQSYDVSGFFLSGPVTITAPPQFEVSLSAAVGFGSLVQTPAPSGGVLASTTVYVRYNPTLQGPHNGAVDHSSPGVPSASLAVSGSVPPLPGQVQTSTGTLALMATAVGVAAEGHYEVSGFNLSDSITVAASAPFEISLTPGAGFGAQVQTGMPVGGAVGPTRIYVRYLPAAAGVVSGTITHDTVGVASLIVNLTGDVAPPPTGSGGDGGGGCAMGAAFAPLWLMAAAALRRRRKARH